MSKAAKMKMATIPSYQDSSNYAQLAQMHGSVQNGIVGLSRAIDKDHANPTRDASFAVASSKTCIWYQGIGQ